LRGPLRSRPPPRPGFAAVPRLPSLSSARSTSPFEEDSGAPCPPLSRGHELVPPLGFHRIGGGVERVRRRLPSIRSASTIRVIDRTPPRFDLAVDRVTCGSVDPRRTEVVRAADSASGAEGASAPPAESPPASALAFAKIDNSSATPTRRRQAPLVAEIVRWSLEKPSLPPALFSGGGDRV
jgi:hypothetical protein